MVKVNFIPIALAVVFIYALTQIIKGRHPSLHSFKTSFLKDKKVNIILLFVLFGLCIIFSQRIIYNVVSYGSYSPSCAQVRDINDCRKNSLFRRDEYVKGPGRQPATEPIPNYFVSWGKLMSERTFGIFTSSNRIIPTYRYFEFCLFAIVTLYLVASVRKINKNNPHIIILLAITAFYLAILLRENYNIYQDTGRIALAVQGRYAFVVLPFIYLVGNYYTEALFKKDIYKLGFAFLILITFFVSSLPNFLLNDSHIWYTKAVLSFVT